MSHAATALATEAEVNKFPSQIKYIVGNEACERYSYYGMKSILTVFMIQVLLFQEAEATSTYHLLLVLVICSHSLGPSSPTESGVNIKQFFIFHSCIALVTPFLQCGKIKWVFTGAWGLLLLVQGGLNLVFRPT